MDERSRCLFVCRISIGVHETNCDRFYFRFPQSGNSRSYSFLVQGGNLRTRLVQASRNLIDTVTGYWRFGFGDIEIVKSRPALPSYFEHVPKSLGCKHPCLSVPALQDGVRG